MTATDGFKPRDLAGPDGTLPDDAALLLGTARLLEHEARLGAISPSPGFADSVMAAVADEPTPRPWSALVVALRRGSLGAVAASIGDAWRVAWGAGRPVAVRAQAFAIVTVAAVIIGSAGTIGAVGVSRFLGPTSFEPSPVPTLPAPSAAPTPALESPGPTPAPTSGATETPETSGSAQPSESAPGTSPSEDVTIPPTTGPGSGEGGKETPQPTRSPRPTATSGPTPTPSPTPGPTGSGSPGPTPSGSPTPAPTSEPSERPTPSPSPTPVPSPSPSTSPSTSPSPTPEPTEH